MAKKRGNNEGSIYRRKNGAWRAMVTLQGRRLTHTAKTKSLCQDWLRRTLDEVDNGMTFDSTQVSLGKFMEDWLVTVEPSLRYNTFRRYQQVTNQHICPVLGEHRLRELKPEHIQSLYIGMVKNGLGLRTIRHTHAIIHRALVHAVKLGLISRNPDDATTPPRPIRKEMQFLNENQVQQLLITAKIRNDHLYALYYLAIATGMRQGELLGLKWADLNWDKSALQVQRQLTKKKGGGREFALPKTRAGIRRIDLGNESLQVLKEHHQKQYQLIVATGIQWQDHDLIFPTSIGTPMYGENLIKRFKQLLNEAGLPDIRFHDLRHTAASLMLNNGIPVIIVSRRLGHSQPSITMDVYGHLSPGKQQEAASLIDQLLTPIQIEIPN